VNIFTEIEDELIVYCIALSKILEITIKKATERDGISLKILKIAKPVITKPISELMNKSISLAKFPEKLKEAQVVPCHKKSNALDKSNYRPVR
jgi:hypothetical protein